MFAQPYKSGDNVIDLEVSLELDGTLAAKFSSPEWEINVFATPGDFASLSTVASSDWAGRGSMKVGTTAGSPVFWSCIGDTVSLLVGHDDETWDIAIMLPLAQVLELAEIATRDW